MPHHTPVAPVLQRPHDWSTEIYPTAVPERQIHNYRNNEGLLNKVISVGSSISRRCVAYTAGSWDQLFGTMYMRRIFSFQVDVVKGFWRWYDACFDVKNVWQRSVINGQLPQKTVKYYREHVNYQLVYDSLRGIPVMCCFLIPGGFVILGTSIVILPSWVVFPRTFWNRDQIKNFILEQHTKRKGSHQVNKFAHYSEKPAKGRVLLEDFLEQHRFPWSLYNEESIMLSMALRPMFDARNRGQKNWIDFSRLKPFLKTGNVFSLEKLPLPYLQALAEGHGLYVASKLGLRPVLIRQLKKVARNISLQDKMMKRELLIGYMTQRELDWACYRRGMNPYVNNNRMEMESFLREWLRRSKQIDVENEPAELLFNIAMLPMSPKLRGSTV